MATGCVVRCYPGADQNGTACRSHPLFVSWQLVDKRLVTLAQVDVRKTMQHMLDSGPGLKHSGAGSSRRNDVLASYVDFFNKLLARLPSNACACFEITLRFPPGVVERSIGKAIGCMREFIVTILILKVFV
jgi:hypothetical protein